MKKIIILAVLISLGGSGLFAQDSWGFGSKGKAIAMDIITIAVGGGLAATPLFVSGMDEPPYNYILYGTGGGLALMGLIFLIYDCTTSDSDYYATGKNPILEHVALNVSRRMIYAGGTWHF